MNSMDLVERGVATGSRKCQHRNKCRRHLLSSATRRLLRLDRREPNRRNASRRLGERPTGGSPPRRGFGVDQHDDRGRPHGPVRASETMAGRYWSSSGGQAVRRRARCTPKAAKPFHRPSLHDHRSLGRSRIRVSLTEGSVVTTLKNTVDHVVTEYGIAQLRGASLNERAHRLIAIAHPDHRDKLRFSARKAGRIALIATYESADRISR